MMECEFISLMFRECTSYQISPYIYKRRARESLFHTYCLIELRMSLAEECKSAGLNLDEPRRPRKRGAERRKRRDVRWSADRRRESQKFRITKCNAFSLESKCRGRVSLTFNRLPIGANVARRRNTMMTRGRAVR